MESPLSGIRVLDFGMAAVGPISAEYLGWLGADVIKIESPAGDMVRRGKGGVADDDWAGHTFLGNNIGKRGIVLDLKNDADRATALDLARTADVLLENFRSPDILPRLGLSWERLREANPRLIYLQSSAFGPSGPLVGKPSVEWITQAFGGVTSVQGPPDGAPEFSRGTSSLDWNGAMVNTIAMLTALYVRNRTGTGMRIDTSQFHSTLVAGTTRIAEYLATGVTPRPLGTARANLVPDQAFRTADGYLTVTAPHDRIWRRLCAAIDRPDLADDARFARVADRVRERDALVPELEAVFRARPTAEWVPLLHRAGVPAGAYQQQPTLADSLLANAQMQAEHMISVLPQTGGGEIVTAEPQWKFDKTEARITRPSPLFGEHQQEVLDEIASWQPRSVRPPLPDGDGLALAGLRVVDFSQGVAGALCAMQLGDLGADVIKVEPPEGDWLREIPPFQGGEGALFLQLNRNKRGITLDLKSDAGRAFARRLIADADIVVEGYRPEVMARLGLDYGRVSAKHPALIYCSISGHGTTGPLANVPATEIDVQAAVGANRHLGRPGDPPVRFGYDQASVSAGMAGVQGTLAALIWRDRTGAGQHTRTSMLHAEVGVYQWSFTAERHPADQSSNAFAGVHAEPDHGYQTAEGPVFISLRDYDRNHVPFLRAIGRADLLEDPRFASREAMAAYMDDFRELVNETIGTWSRERVRHAVEDEAGGWFAPMLTIAEAVAHPQAAALGMIATIDHPTVGPLRVINTPIIFDRELASLRLPPPLLGQHTAEIAREYGLDDEQLAAIGARTTSAVG